MDGPPGRRRNVIVARALPVKGESAGGPVRGSLKGLKVARLDQEPAPRFFC
jgi:hypothetical protein